MVHARFDLIGPEGELLEADTAWIGPRGHPPVEPGREFIRRAMGERGRVCASTTLIRRGAVPEGAFLQEDFPPFDFACWMRLAMTWDVAFVDQTLCRYRVHTQSHSAGVSEYRGASYAPGIETLRGIQGARRRQIARTADPSERRVLKRLARQGFRRELLEAHPRRDAPGALARRDAEGARRGGARRAVAAGPRRGVADARREPRGSPVGAALRLS